MKTKKLISLLCAAALTVSSFAGLTINASAAEGDKIADVVALQNFNSFTTGVLVDGDTTKEATSEDVPYLKLVTTNRADTGHYTDQEGTDIVTGNVYSIMEKEDATDKYLRLGYPMFGDFTKNGRYGHVDFVDGDKAAVTYSADATKDYVIEFDAKFTYGMAKGVVSTVDSYNPVLRIGVFDATSKTDNAVAIDKAALEIGDEWIHVKSVTSLKGTKVYLDNAENYAVNSTTTTSVNAFGLYSTNGQTTISPPKDVFNANLDAEILDADKHTFSPTVDIDNLQIYTAEPEKEANVTINFKDASGADVKDAITLTGVVGKQFTVPVANLAPIDAEGDNYYKYASGADAFTVVDGENTVNCVFEAVAKPTITFNATTGDSDTFIAKLGEAKAMPGTTATVADVYSHEYMQDEDGNWYQKVAVAGGPRGNASYDLKAVAGEENSTVNVKYVPAFNVVSFMEAEDTEDVTDGTYNANYPVLNASGGQWVLSPVNGNYPAGFYTDAVAADGKYEISVRYRNPSGRSAYVYKIADGATTADAVEIGSIPSVSSKEGGVGTYTFTADLAAGDTVWVSKTADDGAKIMDEVDYIVVKDANKKADTDPVVTLEYANKTVSLTTDKDAAVKAVVIHTQKGGDVLTKIKAYPVTIASGTTPTDVAIEEAVYDGDKFMVWDSLEGMTPYLATPYTVVGGEEKPKFTVTVADGITNGTVTADKAQAEQGETVTLTITPDTNYEVDAITVTDAESNAVTVSTNNTFTMPASNVTVNVTFKASLYTIKGTVDANVTSVKLTDKADTENVITATIDAGVATAVNVKAGTYTISAKYAAGYEQDAITPANGEITVTADNDTAFAITSKASAKPAITGTVTIAGTADVGETLTANVEGLNAGATAKYEWESAGADGTYAAIANAAAQTYTVTDAMAGKSIKVVVTTDETSGHIDSAPVQIPAYYTITVTTPENGEVAVKAGDTAATKAKADTNITITATPTDGYEVGTITVMNGETAVEVTNNSFTMPAGNVTVTVTFTEALADGELLTSTYISRNGKLGTDKKPGTDELLTVDDIAADANANYSTSGEILVGNPGNYARVGLMKFNATADAADAAPIYRAYLKLTQKTANTNLENGFGVYSVTGDYDASTITFVQEYGTECIADANKAAIQETSPIKSFGKITQIGMDLKKNGTKLPSAADGVTYDADVTDYVKSVKAANGTIYSLALNESLRGITFYGKGSEHEPTLEITRGINATFTVQSAADAETKVANAAIEVKEGDTVVATAKTDANGSATVVLLPNKSYTYTVTSADYAIKKDGTLTTTDAAAPETASLAANVPTTVEITSPEITKVTLEATATFTATVKDQDGRVMADVPVTWSIVDTPANITVTNGTIAATEGATSGDYTVQAAVTANADVKATAPFSVSTAQSATLKAVYTTDGTENGKVSEVVVYGEADAKSAADEVAADVFASYTKPIKVNNAGGATFKIYEYVSGAPTAVTTLAAGENKVYLTVAADGADYYYYEDFEGENALAAWGWTNGTIRLLDGTALTGDNTINTTKVYNAYLSQSNGSREQTFTLKADGYGSSSGKTAFITDIKVGGDPVANTSKTDPGYFEIQGLNDDGAVKIFSFTWGNKNTASDLLGVNAAIWTYPNAADVTNIKIPISTSGDGGFTGLSRDTNTSKWLRLEIELDNSKTENNVSVKIYPLDSTLTIADLTAGTPYTYTCTSTAKNIAKIRGVLPRMNGGLVLDNIKIIDVTE